ncbi:MAG: polysaccharide biosynthesis C-terminal domain-containing protein [Alphaproteobacteria bacterium]|nr:polysaccharide biosynthesis C-terminal domain-containing protein [Alphaproteobacteria bacterium]
MRKKKLLYNTIASLGQEIVTLLCGFILPRFFLMYYGSTVNGLISSITNFLGFVTFLDLGVGAVVQSALYKPLADEDKSGINKIMISARKFFRNIARILLIYIVGLIIIYPFFVSDSFDFVFVASMIVILGINSFAQYYFGVVNQMLLNADQKAYIQLFLQAGTVLLNTIVCIILMQNGCSIHVVKLVTVGIYILRPMGMWLYVKKNYEIDYNDKYEGEPIRQKWNGLAQHIAAVVLDNTDMIVLTCFSTLENVSIYSVHYMVTNGVRRILEKVSTGMQALIGNMYAQKETQKLIETFSVYEWMMHKLITFLFTCTGILIVPFIGIYTQDITDVNYNVPVFAVTLTLAQAVYCIRVPYNMLVKAAGHFKETQISAIVEVCINVIITLAVVIRYGLIGVAVGTLLAMLYRTLYLGRYSLKEILQQSQRTMWQNLLFDIVICALTYLATSFLFDLNVGSYIEWIKVAIGVALVCFLITAVIEALFSRDKLLKVKEYLKNRKK